MSKPIWYLLAIISSSIGYGAELHSVHHGREIGEVLESALWGEQLVGLVARQGLAGPVVELCQLEESGWQPIVSNRELPIERPVKTVAVAFPTKTTCFVAFLHYDGIDLSVTKTDGNYELRICEFTGREWRRVAHPIDFEPQSMQFSASSTGMNLVCLSEKREHMRIGNYRLDRDIGRFVRGAKWLVPRMSHPRVNGCGAFCVVSGISGRRLQRGMGIVHIATAERNFEFATDSTNEPPLCVVNNTGKFVAFTEGIDGRSVVFGELDGQISRDDQIFLPPSLTDFRIEALHLSDAGQCTLLAVGRSSKKLAIFQVDAPGAWVGPLPLPASQQWRGMMPKVRVSNDNTHFWAVESWATLLQGEASLVSSVLQRR